MQTTTTLSTKSLRSVASALRSLDRGRSFAAATRDLHPELAATVQAHLDAAKARREAAAVAGF